jgi:2-phospho-L-lactate guanylyltransferase
MQATVASFDVESRSGTVVTDAGVTLDFAAAALAEHIRHVRPGQRVFIDATADRIEGIRLW